MEKEDMKAAVAEAVTLCVARFEVAEPELELATWVTATPGGELRTTLVRTKDEVIGMVDVPVEWRPVLGYRRIEIDFSDPNREPQVRVMGGDDFDDPAVCTIATGVYRDGRMVWNRQRKAS